MTTIKLEYWTDESSERILNDYLRQYNSCLHVVYNFIKDNSLSTNYQEHIKTGSIVLEKMYSLNNVDLIVYNYHLRGCVISDACDMIKAEEALKVSDESKLNGYKEDLVGLKEYRKNLHSGKKTKRTDQKIRKLEKKITSIENRKYVAVFGGNNNFVSRCKGNISREDFLVKRISPLYSKGSTEHFNRLFCFVDETTILFKPTKDLHITLKIGERKHKHQIKTLLAAQNNKELPCTFKLGHEHIYISYEPSKLNERKHSSVSNIQNRYMSIDLNPNHIGYTVTDWYSENCFKIIDKGIFSIKEINDDHFSLKGKGIPSDDPRRIYVNNKREHEVYEISKNLVNIAIHYRCGTFCVEKLNISSDDKNRGRKYNSLCNNMWNRDKLVGNIQKRCDIFRIKFTEIMPNYSSFVGNFLFRSLDLPDMVLAAFEIGRRTYQYTYNNTLPKDERKKNILLPDVGMFEGFLAKSLEEFGIEDTFRDLRRTYEIFKKARKTYRLSVDQFNLRFIRFRTVKSKIGYTRLTDISYDKI